MHTKTYLKFAFKHILLRKKINAIKKNSIHEIDFDALKDQGVKLIIFDMDDTLSDFKGLPDEKTKALLQTLQDKKFKLAIFSNCSEERTRELKKISGNSKSILIVTRSDKPKSAGYKEIIWHFRASPNQTVMVGDRLGTDIYGAFRAKIKHLILVEPYSSVFGGKKAPRGLNVIRSIEKKFVRIKD